MMKFSALLFLSSILTFSTFAQADFCGTDEFTQEWMDQNPEKAEEFLYKQKNLLELSDLKGNQNSKAPVITVPVVVHVVHFNGDGNISKAQIDDGMRILNEDFQKLNADTSQIRSVFQPIAADVQIEFKLARKDPNGNCTEGINRVSSYLTYEANNQVKSVSQWDATKYLNVWIVKSIGSGTQGTTLGYAQFPGSGSLNTYGLVVIASEWGSIGSASSATGRTITHEVGHCFDLVHTFQGGCGTFCTSSGDFVCDTPPTFTATFGCNTSNNTCSNDASGGTSQNPNPYSTNVPDQLENHMSYDDCRVMFTEGQKDRMLRAFNIYSQLVSLKSNSNLLATGTNNGYVVQQCAPIADMIYQKQFICTGDSLSFIDDSYGGPTTNYNWSFPGGSPSTSTDSIPTITYNSPGTYDIILRVSNSSGADTLVISEAVKVANPNNAVSGYNYFEGFESTNVIGNDWEAINFSGNPEWARVGIASFTGNGSAFLNNNNNEEGERDVLVSPPIDLTQVINPRFRFRVAYRIRNLSSNDVLRGGVSLDCGKTWSNRIFLTSSSMSSGVATNNYVPTSASDWLSFTIPTTNAMQNSNNVLFRFDFTSGGGNNIFIDDFEVLGQPVGMEEQNMLKSSFTVYPNPTNGSTTKIEFTNGETAENATIYTTNILGERVKEVYRGELQNTNYQFELNTSSFSAGVYFITLESEKGRITKKLIVK